MCISPIVEIRISWDFKQCTAAVDLCLSSEGLLWLNLCTRAFHRWSLSIPIPIPDMEDPIYLQYCAQCPQFPHKTSNYPSNSSLSRENIFSALYCLLKLGKSYNGILSTLPKEFSQISALVLPYLQQLFTNFSFWGGTLLQILSSPTISILRSKNNAIFLSDPSPIIGNACH